MLYFTSFRQCLGMKEGEYEEEELGDQEGEVAVGEGEGDKRVQMKNFYDRGGNKCTKRSCDLIFNIRNSRPV